MNVVVLGASGKAGQAIVKRALEKGHRVTAFVRNPASLSLVHPNLQLKVGDALSQDAVSEAVKGQDAVVHALSAKDHSHRMVFITHIVNAMRTHKVKRIAALGGIGALQASEHLKVYETATFPREYVEVTQAHIRVLDALKTSRLDFTFVCPPLIQDGDRTGAYNSQANYPTTGWTIYSGDLADFLVSELEKNNFVGEKVGVSNT